MIRETRVQGKGAATAIVTALAALASHPEVDVVVLARGGGSFEDLLPFSDEAVVRAVAACRVPVVSAVGHEQDTPLCDLAADVRAATPTAAGALVVPDLVELAAALSATRRRLGLAVRAQLERDRSRLVRQGERLRAAPRLLLERRRAALDHSGARLQALSPLATLNRGYAIVRAGGDALRNAAAGRATGDHVDIQLAAGALARRSTRCARERARELRGAPARTRRDRRRASSAATCPSTTRSRSSAVAKSSTRSASRVLREPSFRSRSSLHPIPARDTRRSGWCMNRPMSKPTPALLRNVRLFSDLDERDLESLAEEFNERRFSAGDKIALEGEGGLMFFVVESGELSVEVHGEPVSTMGPGAAFGEIALIDRRPRTATVTAATDVTAYGLPVFVFRPFVEARPQVAWKMLEAMADRLAVAEAR